MKRFKLSVAALILGSIVGFVLISGLAATQANAASVRKVGGLSDSGDCMTTACKTIGYALSQAAAGDTILVGPGLYKESIIIDKSVVLSGNGATIDGSGHDNAVLDPGPG